MEEWLKYLAIVNTFFEFLCILLISEDFIGKTRKRNKLFCIIICICILFCNVLINFYDVYRFVYVLNYFLIFLLLKKEYDIKWRESLKYTAFCVVFVCVLELLIYVILQGFSSFVFGSGDMTSVTPLITFILCIVIKNSKILFIGKKWFYKWNTTLYLVFASIILMLIYYMNSVKMKNGMFLAEVLQTIILIFLFFLFVYKFVIYHMENELHKKYSERYSEVIVAIRERQHKFMNQLHSICMLSEIYKTYEELVENQRKEINALKSYMMPNKIILLERPLIIAHIYSKICEAEERGIDLQIEISCSIQDVEVPDIYMVEIIGNLLDNAMDEVEKRRLNEQIIFSIFPVEEKICISVSNEHDKIPYKLYHQFCLQKYSTKGVEHGFGLPYVKKLVNKYGGEIELGNVEHSGKNFFTIQAYIKNKGHN